VAKLSHFPKNAAGRLQKFISGGGNFSDRQPLKKSRPRPGKIQTFASRLGSFS
jgi:hypothetical protein